MKPRQIYIAGRYRAPTRWGIVTNCRAAEAVAYEVARIGGFPCCPHTNTALWFEDLGTAEFWLEGTLEWMRRCDAVIMVPGWEQSSGARAERAEAIRLHKPVFETIAELHRWLIIDCETVVTRVEGAGEGQR